MEMHTPNTIEFRYLVHAVDATDRPLLGNAFCIYPMVVLGDDSRRDFGGVFLLRDNFIKMSLKRILEGFVGWELWTNGGLSDHFSLH